MIRPTRPLALITVLVLLLAGCSSSGGKRAEQQSESDARITVAMISHGAKGDTFWDLVRKGAEEAADRHNIDLKYYSAPEAQEQANLVQNAVDQDVDGIAVTLAKPQALRSALAKAKGADIPVVGFNAGVEEWRQTGVLAYYGSDDRIAGRSFGKRLNDVGAHKALCVIHEQGQVSLESRCSALRESFRGKTETLYVNGESMPDVRSSITSRLQEDQSVDFVAALGAPVAMTATRSVSEAGSDAQVATFDTNEELVHAIKDGRVRWAVDQQPYLQGYLSVSGLWLYDHNANISGGGVQPVLTGPDFVDKSNVQEIARYAERGTR